MSDLFSFEFGLTAVLSIIISNQYKLRLHQADTAGIGSLEGVPADTIGAPEWFYRSLLFRLGERELGTFKAS